MNKFILFIGIALLTACASSSPDKDINEGFKKKENLVSELDDVVELEQSQAVTERLSEQKVTVTGSRMKMLSSRLAASPSIVAYPYYQEPVDTENYKYFEDNQVSSVWNSPVSTFSIDVDTGAYANIRRMLNQGQIPRKDAVRVEELINYFSYDYVPPNDKSTPFSTITELVPSPWNSNAHLLHIGIKGYEIEQSQRPNANLVFLLDVSGSMNSADKLGLLKSSLKLLVKKMNKQDLVSIVVYAGAAGVVLEPTSGANPAKIIAALDKLSAGGSTNGAQGIELAYNLAEQNFIKDGINRIIIATDGDFNVGTVNFEALKELVEAKRKTGISLTTLGFGTGNYNDHLMEQLANVGNGNYAYIDTIKEANKVLVNEMSSTLFTIAKDVKIQIEFNPKVVSEYRLIGYENRKLNREDFSNDKIDAGEIGAGHSVTAIYEVVLSGNKGWLESLRYQNKATHSKSNELAYLRIRYKQPDQDKSQLLEWALNKSDIKPFKQASNDFRFAASVAAFGQLLRGGKYLNNFSYSDVLKLSQTSKGEDRFGYRGEFVQLVSLADSLIN